MSPQSRLTFRLAVRPWSSVARMVQFTAPAFGVNSNEATPSALVCSTCSSSGMASRVRAGRPSSVVVRTWIVLGSFCTSAPASGTTSIRIASAATARDSVRP